MSFLYFFHISVVVKVFEDNHEFNNLIADIHMPTMERGTIKVAGYSKSIQQQLIHSIFIYLFFYSCTSFQIWGIYDFLEYFYLMVFFIVLIIDFGIL